MVTWFWFWFAAPQAGLREVYKSNDKMAGLDAAMKSRMNQLTSNVISACLPAGARKPFPDNCLALMIQSGAKGSSVNSSQISCLLGQQVRGVFGCVLGDQLR
jgi:DNA-directed RNA polymerase I subunit RPA1